MNCKASQRKNKLFSEVLTEFIEYVKEVKGLKKNQAKTVTGNHFEKMEKVRFILEQEGYELDQLLQDTLHNRDEIDTFLRNRINTKLVHASGAFKLLETMTFSHEHDSVNYDSLMKLVDRRIENEMPRTAKKKDLIHEITRNIFSKVQKAQQKKLKDLTIFTPEYYQKKLAKIDLDGITVEKEVQTEDEEEGFRRKSMAVRKMMKNKEIDNYTKDLEAYNEEVLRKCHAFELQKNKLENENGEITMKVRQLELKLKVKKEKIMNLKVLIKELRDKLAELSEREANNHMLFKNKEKECEKLIIKQEEVQVMLNLQVKEMSLKQEIMEKNFRENNLLRLNSRIEEKSSLSVYDQESKLASTSIENDNSKSTSNRKKSKKRSSKPTRASTEKSDNKKESKSPENQSSSRANLMTRSRSVFLDVVKSKNSLRKSPTYIQNAISISKENLSLNSSMISKNIIESGSSEKKLETLEENPNDSILKSEGSSPIKEDPFEKDSVISDENKTPTKDRSIGKNQTVETQDMACLAKPDHKEKECSVEFVDKVENYLKKLQKMAADSNQAMKFIIERIFLKRNHKQFVQDLVDFIKWWNSKKMEKGIQTDGEFLISVKPVSPGGKKPARKKIMSKTSYISGSFKREISEITENQEAKNAETIGRQKKSQSQHVKSSYPAEKIVRPRDRHPSFREDSTQIISLEKIKVVEKPNLLANFLFNKAITGPFDKNSEFHRVNSQDRKMPRNFLEGYQMQKPLDEEMIMRVDIKKEEQEEDFEREKLIKRLSQHIKEMKTKNVENFSKIKHFFNYPFKSVKEIVGNEPDVGFEDGRIQEIITEFVNKHKICGSYCKHLQRFFQRIGFINIQTYRKEAKVHKQNINKLPNVGDF